MVTYQIWVHLVKLSFVDTNLIVSSTAEELSIHDMKIDSLTDDMLILEETVDGVEDGMTALQVVNNDILDRLIVLEEVVNSKCSMFNVYWCYWSYRGNNFHAVSYCLKTKKSTSIYFLFQYRGQHAPVLHVLTKPPVLTWMLILSSVCAGMVIMAKHTKTVIFHSTLSHLHFWNETYEFCKF